MSTVNAYNLKRKANKGHGFSMVEVVLSVAIIGLLSVTALTMYMGVSKNSAKASMQSEMSSMVNIIESSLLSQDKEKLIVENGGKFPNISIDSDVSTKNATLFVAHEKQLVDIANPKSISYEISTDLDGYSISGFIDTGEKVTEILKYDSETREFENVNH